MMSRCYVVVNQYISGIQAGVQAAHAVAEMAFRKKDNPLTEKWVQHDRTLIVLRGKGDEWMRSMFWNSLRPAIKKLDLPYGFFEEPGIRNAMTAFSVILPKEVIEFQDRRPTICLPVNPPKFIKDGELTEIEHAMLDLKEFYAQLNLAT
jgi:hypothetical protein